MIRFFNTFTKITAYPVQKACFNTKILYEDKSVQNRRIKGPAIVVCNHTSVYDYAVLLFVFFSRTVRYQMAEVLFKKKLKTLSTYMKKYGVLMQLMNQKNIYIQVYKTVQLLVNLNGELMFLLKDLMIRKSMYGLMPYLDIFQQDSFIVNTII